MNAFTQYLFGAKDTAIRRVKVLAYDGNKYAIVKDYETRRYTSVKHFYLCEDQTLTRRRLTPKMLRRLECRRSYFSLLDRIGGHYDD